MNAGKRKALRDARVRCIKCRKLTESINATEVYAHQWICDTCAEINKTEVETAFEPTVKKRPPITPTPKPSLDSRYRKSHLKRKDIQVLTKVFGFHSEEKFLEFLDEQEAIQDEVARRINRHP